MQLKAALLVAAVAAILLPAAAAAQSLSPTRGSGPTPSDIKGFRLVVGNPYKTAMVFLITPMDTGFSRAAGDAVAQPARVKLAPGLSRQVILAFKIPPHATERTIGLCITPEHIAGPVRPRVCGRYAGVRLPGSGG